ncbi:MAG: EamA family transporter [Pseudomonadota bacterium]|uniref:DMT family transporter n=1 Tax=Polaromonas sp. TaxID=1869339 RepID=UPI0017D0B323|nr:EamA family transporter [Polaromonas sp.]MBA3595585.1 EamA family transporter [Polaromonas sp.]MDQ3271838.1 EamA family transporter [Pseudomonadota bacterium]
MQALWMLAAAFFFATMAVCVKFASEHFNSAELVFYRGLLGILFMWLLARSRGIPLATRYPGMHMWRSLVGVISLGAWFYAIAQLPLATAMTLNYMSSVWIAAFLVGGALLMGLLPARSTDATNTATPSSQDGAAEPAVPGRRRSAPSGGSAVREATSVGATFNQGPLVLTVIAGFIGVIMMLRPTIEQNQAFAGLVGLMSGLLAAFAYMQVMALARIGEPETRTVFYFAVGSAVAGGLAITVTGVSEWHWKPALWLIPLGVLASLGQLCMTRAYSLARTRSATLVVANLQYSGIVFGAIYSLLLFGERLPLIGWAGMALIMASGIAATVLRARAAPGAPAEEH